MPEFTRREMLAAAGGATAAALLGSTAQADPASATGGDHRLWYDFPAETPRHALVVGNGRLGAMIAGQPRFETIPLNEDTLWCGQPHPRTIPDGRDALRAAREAAFAGDYGRAEQECRRLQGAFSHSYAPMADLRLEFDHDGEVVDYSRALDLDAATTTVDYAVEGARFTREVFVSHPDQLIVMRLRSSRAGGLRVRVALDSQLRHTARADAAGVTLQGKAPTYCAPSYNHPVDPIVYSDKPGEGMHFACRLEILSGDGRAVPDGDGVRIDGAQEVVLAIAAATGFRSFDVAPDRPADEVLAAAQATVAAARGKGYDALHGVHTADHQSLYRRLSLRLGGEARSALPTDQRLSANQAHPEPALAALYMNFSRYLLIACSRAGTQAANLQGVWNWELRPPWSSNYTTNINVQQNYWGAESCNLAELHGPMIDLVEQLARSGAATAERLYGLDGWCVHHNSDLWRLSTPVGEGRGDPTWANFALAGPWLARHLWEHYLYGQDREFLARRAYPLLKGCASFCAGWLVRDPRTGGLTTAPSVSTENSFIGPDGVRRQVSAGCTMDIAMIREVFAFTREAAAILGVDRAFAARLKTLSDQLPPYRIGGHGQLQEWEFDFAESEPEQRHISHLYPVCPGWEITPRSHPELARAAGVAMQRRLDAGGGGTGWSRAWAVNVFARLGDGERAFANLNTLLAGSTGPTLLDVLPSGGGPLFQIDGNFGGGAAVIEMILQSHDGAIAFLPALPRAWGEGELKGVRARGGVTLDMAWSNGRMQAATLHAAADGFHLLRPPSGQTVARVVEGGRTVAIDQAQDGARVRLARGKAYEVAFA